MILPLIPKEHSLMDEKSYEKYRKSWYRQLGKQWRMLELCALALAIGISASVVACLIIIFWRILV